MLSKSRFVMALIFSAIWLSGCASGPSVLPTSFSTVMQAFSGGDHLNPPPNMPSDARKNTTVPVTYEDAYRAAVVSLTQAQIDIENENKAEGVVLAQQIVQVVPGFQPTNNFNNQRSLERRYFYAIVLQEKGAELTQITAYAKVQGRCYFAPATFGLPSDKVSCQHYSTVHWASGVDSAQEHLSQFMIFLRNNLIAAGAM